MGIDTPSGDTRRVAELDRLIEGRWTLINRLFEDVEQLVEERDRLAGRGAGFLGRLLGRRQRAPAPDTRMVVQRPEIRRRPKSRSSGRAQGQNTRAAS